MCIIAYVPAGKKLSEETIKTMFFNNPDGAGIMWKPNGKEDVQIRKGFMNVDDLLKAFKEIPQKCERAIHCRIATAGKISVDCCHPFPIRPKVDSMRSAVDKCVNALMHNGVIEYANPPMGIKATYSDSMNFSAKFLFPLSKAGLLDKEFVQTLIENSTPSRLLIMRKGRETLMFGNWVFEDGIYYSNTSFKPYIEKNDYNGFYNYGYGDCNSYIDDDGSCWETVILDIADMNPKEAEELIYQELDALYLDGYVTLDYCKTGELCLCADKLPNDLIEFAGFRIMERHLDY